MKNWGLLLSALLLASLPASNNYKLNNYGFGSGGTAGSASTTYKLNGTAGEQSNIKVNSGNFATGSGNNGTQQANVPTIAITNPNNSYNSLLIVIGIQNNPSDATFAVAISTDSFTTTNYVKSDNTVGSSLALADYRTYAGWGSGSGTTVIGLTPHTLYSVKAKAMQGNFTETGYGPVASVSTADPQLTFSLSTSTQPSPPFSVAIGLLLAGTVVTAPSTINIAITTNGSQGAKVYISDSNSGLKSTAYPSATIASASTDLSSAGNGYGVQVSSASQVAALSPYNVATSNVGIISSAIRQILNSSGPTTAGTATITIKAKAASSDTAAPDYTDVMTFLAAGSF